MLGLASNSSGSASAESVSDDLQAVDYALDHPDEVYDGAVDKAANFMGHELASRGNDTGLGSSFKALASGLSYEVGNAVGYTDILEAGYNTDLQTQNYIDPTGGWNDDRILRMNSGVGKAANAGSTLVSSYSTVGSAGKLTTAADYAAAAKSAAADVVGDMGGCFLSPAVASERGRWYLNTMGQYRLNR